MLFSMILQLFSVFITRRRSENSIETAAVTVTVQGHYDVRQAPVVFGIIARCLSKCKAYGSSYYQSYKSAYTVVY